MKVLHILDSLNRGGAEVLELDVCRNAKKNDLDLTFVATGSGTLEEDFRTSGSEFIRLNRKFPIDVFLISKLRQIIQNKHINIIHTHQAVEGIHAYLASLGTKTKIVLSHHGFVADTKNYQILKFLIPRVAKNIYVSEALRKWYLTDAKLNSNINFEVIFNGVDEKRLKFNGENLKTELNLSENSLLIGMISNFYVSPRKDQLTLCKAFVKVAEKIPNAHLVLVGKVENGAESKFADCIRVIEENNLADRSHFLGMRTDIPKILNSLDIFALSSLHEGLPIAVIEAMLAKIPCVLSDIAPLLEVSENGQFAETFPVQNAEILAKKIIDLLQNSEKRKNLAEQTYKFANNQYSIETHIKHLKELYKNLS